MKKFGLTMLGATIYIGRHRTKKTLKRINLLLKDIERNGCLMGIGEPEALRGNLQGEYSRRINEKDRLVYHMENGRIYIVHCKGHYDDK